MILYLRDRQVGKPDWWAIGSCITKFIFWYDFCTFSLCIKLETLRSYGRSCQGKLGGVAGPV